MVRIKAHGQFFVVFSIDDGPRNKSWLVIGVHYHSAELIRRAQFEELLTT